MATLASVSELVLSIHDKGVAVREGWENDVDFDVMRCECIALRDLASIGLDTFAGLESGAAVAEGK